MSQKTEWEKEYRESTFVTLHDEPQKFFLRFLKFLKKSNIDISKLHAVDLGCGTGRNANYLAEQGTKVIGIEISDTAIRLAQKRAEEKDLDVKYILGDIGLYYDIPGASIDLAVDVTASNSLNEHERDIYLEEVNRVLKNKGYLFVRALCKDGDKNAKKLLKLNPGDEYNTYIIPETGIKERVFSKKDFYDFYSKYFKIVKLKKESGYSKFNKRNFKRNFWIAYLIKK